MLIVHGCRACLGGQPCTRMEVAIFAPGRCLQHAHGAPIPTYYPTVYLTFPDSRASLSTKQHEPVPADWGCCHADAHRSLTPSPFFVSLSFFFIRVSFVLCLCTPSLPLLCYGVHISMPSCFHVLCARKLPTSLHVVAPVRVIHPFAPSVAIKGSDCNVAILSVRLQCRH